MFTKSQCNFLEETTGLVSWKYCILVPNGFLCLSVCLSPFPNERNVTLRAITSPLVSTKLNQPNDTNGRSKVNVVEITGHFTNNKEIVSWRNLCKEHYLPQIGNVNGYEFFSFLLSFVAIFFLCLCVLAM